MSKFYDLETFKNMGDIECIVTIQSKLVPKGDPSGNATFQHGNAFKHVASTKQCTLGTLTPFSDQFQDLFRQASNEPDTDEMLYVVDGGCMPNGKIVSSLTAHPIFLTMSLLSAQEALTPHNLNSSLIATAIYDPFLIEKTLVFFDKMKQVHHIYGEFHEVGPPNLVVEPTDSKYKTSIPTSIGSQAEYFGLKGYYVVWHTLLIICSGSNFDFNCSITSRLKPASGSKAETALPSKPTS